MILLVMKMKLFSLLCQSNNLVKLTVVFFLIIFMGNASALKFGISPYKIDFKGGVGEEVCKSLTFYSDSSVSIIGEDKWKSENFSDLVSDYTLDSKEINLEVSYPNSFSFKFSKSSEVCITSYTNKSYFGVLIYKVENGYSGIGVLMRTDFSGSDGLNDEGKKSVKITGNTVNINKNPGNNIALLLVLIAIDFLCLLVLLGYLRKKNQGFKKFNLKIN